MQRYPRFLAQYSLMIILTGLLVACGSPTHSTNTTYQTNKAASATNVASSADRVSQQASANKVSSSSPQVHMKDMGFLQSSITIKKGESITLISDTPTPHQITNGSWSSGGLARSVSEAGAPHVNITVPGNSQQTIGPFLTVGTFHYYCTIHQGMNLTVIVRPS